jgi:hypothetical protein
LIQGKPVLFPVNTIDGITVTRSYPIKLGERTDILTIQGIWLNYESVNGLDFWNNSTAIPVEKEIITEPSFISRSSQKASGNKAILVTTAICKTDNKHCLMN